MSTSQKANSCVQGDFLLTYVPFPQTLVLGPSNVRGAFSHGSLRGNDSDSFGRHSINETSIDRSRSSPDLPFEERHSPLAGSRPIPTTSSTPRNPHEQRRVAKRGD